MPAQKRRSGNPIIPGKGVCDPHVRIYDDRAYLYATHDKGPENETFVMEDWWIRSTPDLVDWRGSIIFQQNVDPALRDTGDWTIDRDRHGSFFEWRGQWYFICNEMGVTRSKWFRDSSLCYVNYRSGGEIEPVQITLEGVSLPGEKTENR